MLFPLNFSRPGGGIVMNVHDLDYYRARLVAEEAAAEQARHPLAAESHRRLAEHYSRMILTAKEAEEAA